MIIFCSFCCKFPLYFAFLGLPLVWNRFYGDEKQTLEVTEKRLPLPMFKSSAAPFQKQELGTSKKSIFKIPRFGRFKVFPENFEIERDKILDPGGDVVLQWNRVFLFWCLVALYVDPLFFFLSSVKNTGRSSCMTTDLKLGIVITFFRTLADLFYVLHIVIKFRTAYVSRTSRVFGRGELVKDPKLIARRYLRSDFIVDLIACLPLPQVPTRKQIFVFLCLVRSPTTRLKQMDPLGLVTQKKSLTFVSTFWFCRLLVGLFCHQSEAHTQIIQQMHLSSLFLFNTFLGFISFSL